MKKTLVSNVLNLNSTTFQGTDYCNIGQPLPINQKTAIHSTRALKTQCQSRQGELENRKLQNEYYLCSYIFQST